MTITTLPVLSRSSPTFQTEVDTYFQTQLPTFSTQINTEIDRINQIGFGSYSATSTTSLAIGLGTKNLTVETGKGLVVGMWIMLAYSTDPGQNMVGQLVSYNASNGALVIDASSISGSGTYANWVVSITATPAQLPGITRVTKTSAYTLTVNDKGGLIDCSSTWTLGFTAAATLGAGWWCYVRNIGTGTITADPNAAELIDGVTSGAIRPGMTLLVQCDGTEFHCVRVGPQVAQEVLTSGTSWTCPLGIRSAKARIQGAGGSGGCGPVANQAFSSGSAGGYAEHTFLISPGVTYTYAIGSGGSAVSGTGVAGNAGGATSITVSGITVTANGGLGGNATAPSGGAASNGSLNVSGLPGYASGAITNNTPSFEPPGVLGSYGKGGSGAIGGQVSKSGGPGVIILEY